MSSNRLPKTRKPSLAQLRRDMDTAVRRIQAQAERVGFWDGRRAGLPDGHKADEAFKASLEMWNMLGEHQAAYQRALNAYARALKQARDKEQ